MMLCRVDSVPLNLFSLCFSPISPQASVLRQPTSPPPPCPASSRPSSTASPASRISPTDTRPWRRSTPTACRPTPPRAPRQPTPSSRPSPGCSSTQVWPPGASVYLHVYSPVALVSGESHECWMAPTWRISSHRLFFCLSLAHHGGAASIRGGLCCSTSPGKPIRWVHHRRDEAPDLFSPVFTAFCHKHKAFLLY